ncbi:MAG: Uma2 family endonuclease [Candidatus Schekmanbacteria bacterium]|nr:Uma2 family endonuclease [Candidatus Schekmanbacteria bacterium]
MESALQLQETGEKAIALDRDDLPRVEDLVTEDDTPVDNLGSEKNQRLLTEPLYSSWHGGGRKFVAAANVGLFFSVREPPVVPDAFLSLDVEVHPDYWAKVHRTYFFWEFGKAPDVVIEIVSNARGGERRDKMVTYARMGIPYCAIFDPSRRIQAELLTAYRWTAARCYEEVSAELFPGVGLGLAVWRGTFEDGDGVWLRWREADGELILTGSERAQREQERADHEQERADREQERADREQERADREQERADREQERADRLAVRLRELGIEPD